ncbi:MAG: F0F1 ATP synthase subunit B [Anaerolineae bacterium]|nr:F0F1 ATP synthase subunit B [Anaerolineae bacterium]
MLFDWFTVVAQIVNFLVLVFLLRRFLYQPLLDAIGGRRERIAAQFEEAERLAREAEEEARAYRSRVDDLERQRDQLLAEAREDAEALRRELRQEAQRSVEAEHAAWCEELRREKEAFLYQLRERTRDEVLALSRRALSDMADGELERQMAAAFVRRLRELEPDNKRLVRELLNEADEAVSVTSAFPLPAESRQAIEEAVREEFGREDTEVRFRLSPDVIAGVEMLAGGYKLSWTIASYLESLQENMGEVLEAQLRREGERADG